MKTGWRLTVLAGAIASLGTTSAVADINIGGWGGLGFDGGSSVGGLELRGDILVSYDRPDFSVGIGFNEYLTFDPTTGTFVDGPGDFYVLARFQNATLTFGETFGAGSLFPEDYFGYRDTTSISDQVVRLDFSIGQHNFAISNDLNGSSASEIELGYSGAIAGYDVAFGFEADNDEIGLLIGRDHGPWGFQVAAIQDIYNTPGPWNHAGITVFYDITSNLTVAGNVAYGTTPGIGLHSYGVLVTYSVGDAVFKAEFNNEVFGGVSDVEFGVIIPFGKPQPSAIARFRKKEFRRRFVR